MLIQPHDLPASVDSLMATQPVPPPVPARRPGRNGLYGCGTETGPSSVVRTGPRSVPSASTANDSGNQKCVLAFCDDPTSTGGSKITRPGIKCVSSVISSICASPWQAGPGQAGGDGGAAASPWPGARSRLRRRWRMHAGRCARVTASMQPARPCRRAGRYIQYEKRATDQTVGHACDFKCESDLL